MQLPPYFDRFLEERDRRIASELDRLEAAVKHNGAEIARVLREMDRRSLLLTSYFLIILLRDVRADR